jgi:hypothetical protein
MRRSPVHAEPVPCSRKLQQPRLKFNRYVIDKAADQGQQVDAAAIIKVTTPGASPHQDPPARKRAPDSGQAVCQARAHQESTKLML